jgi:hypothetical protein
MPKSDMPVSIRLGQKWSAWVPSRGQWLLSTVVDRDNGNVTLRYDVRYGVLQGVDEQKADEGTMLSNTNLFRLVEV